jgi:hypothetical protein
MNNGQSWLKRAAGSVLLVLGIALGSRLVWELLAPLVPVLGSLVFICALTWVLLRRR